MAMTVYHNNAAQLSLGELNKNINKVGKALAMVASGQKINSAKDDSASFAISEVMREKLRTLEQDAQNVQNGSAMFRIASGGIQSIVDELRELRQLAIDAANDSNTDDDRRTMQKVFDQKRANINDIATSTDYNTKRLLDGTYGRYRTSAAVTRQDLAEPSNAIDTITTDYTITENGVYTLGDGCDNIKITIQSPASNVKLVGSSNGNRNVIVECQPTTHLWLENYKVDVTATSSNDVSAIRFHGSNNSLHIVGSNEINYVGSRKAAMHVGGGLSIYGDEDSSLHMTKTAWTYGAIIGSDANDTSTANSNIVINTKGTMNIEGPQVGAAIGAGSGGSIGDITINSGTIRTVAGGGTPAIGTGRESGRAGTITVNGGNIEGYRSGIAGYDADVMGACRNGDEAIVRDIKLNGGTIHLDNSGDGNAIDPSYNPPGTFRNGYRIYDQKLPDVEPTDGSDAFPSETVFSTSIVLGEPLTIHHGTKDHEATNFFINDMHTKSLHSAVPNVHDLDTLLNTPDFVDNNRELVNTVKTLRTALNNLNTDPAALQREPLATYFIDLRGDSSYMEQYPLLQMLPNDTSQATATLREYPILQSMLEEAIINREVLDNAGGGGGQISFVMQAAKLLMM